MSKLVLGMIGPYRGWVAVIFIAMLFETAMSMAGPWPLKVVIDNVLGTHPLPDWLRWIDDLPLGGSKMALAALAAVAVVAIAAIGALATYIDNYYTESVGQWVANDLRLKVYDHLQHLSLDYYDKQQTGVLLSTITNDVATVQNFASSNTLDILVDLLTIVGILALMLWLEWDFALICVAVTRRRKYGFASAPRTSSIMWSDEMSSNSPSRQSRIRTAGARASLPAPTMPETSTLLSRTAAITGVTSPRR